jgi:nitrate reductase gamma subunit
MENWLTFARGPLFTLTFLIMVLGLMRLVVIQTYSLVRDKGRRLVNAPWRHIVAEGASWVVPVRHMIPGTKFFSTISYLCHIGLLMVPLFLADHVALWKASLGLQLPAINYGFADFLTLFTIFSGFILLGFRIFSRRLRSMSRRSDYVLLLLVLLPFVTGYMASHPRYNPLRWDVMMLIHLLSAELLFAVIPFTKLSHVVLFFFDRISVLHWQLRPGAGDRVAEALYGREARV